MWSPLDLIRQINFEMQGWVQMDFMDHSIYVDVEKRAADNAS